MQTLNDYRFIQSKQKKNADPLFDMYAEKCAENLKLKNRIAELETQVLKLGGTIPRTKPIRLEAHDLVYDDIKSRLGY